MGYKWSQTTRKAAQRRVARFSRAFEASGFSKGEAAEYLGVSQHTINDWLGRRTVPIKAAVVDAIDAFCAEIEAQKVAERQGGDNGPVAPEPASSAIVGPRRVTLAPGITVMIGDWPNIIVIETESEDIGVLVRRPKSGGERK